MTLKKFDKELRNLDINEKARPFVCDGSPLDCNTFLIGHNSSTDGLFWDFWKPESVGFKKDEWLKEYKSKNDFNRKTTRRRIEIFFEEFANTNIQLLQTNLYCFPTVKNIPMC